MILQHGLRRVFFNSLVSREHIYPLVVRTFVPDTSQLEENGNLSTHGKSQSNPCRKLRMKLSKMRSESTASGLEYAADGRLTLKTLRHLRVLGDSYPGVKQESTTDLRHTQRRRGAAHQAPGRRCRRCSNKTSHGVHSRYIR